MMTDPIERPVLSYVHGQFFVLDENVDVAIAVKHADAKNAETIIVTRPEKAIGIVTDSDILCTTTNSMITPKNSKLVGKTK